MPRSFPAFLALALAGTLVGAPAHASAQVRISLQWNGIHSGGPFVHAEIGAGGAYVVGSFGHPSVRYRSARPHRSAYVGRGVRIPPGHLPGPGQCRVWHPNRPPGHQPPPFRCSDRYHDPYGAGYSSGSRYGPVYGGGSGGGTQVYPRPEYGPVGGYYNGYQGVTAETPPQGRVDAPGRAPDLATAQRWEGLEQRAQQVRQNLQRQGRGGAR